MFYLRFFTVALLLGVSGCATLISDYTVFQDSIQIEAKPINAFDRNDPQRRVFGSLEFRGGLELSSDDPRFGGISALRTHVYDQNFLALSDRGYWLRGRIVYTGNCPSAIADAAMAPIIGSDGERATGWDAESMAINGNRLYVGVEDLGCIPCFLLDTVKFPAFLDAIPFPPGAKDLPPNRGLEALEFIPKNGSPDGVLVAFSEKGLDKNGNLKSYIIDGTVHRSFTVTRSNSFDISDAVRLPDGDLLILERKYEIINGIEMRLRRIPVGEIRPYALIDGPVVMEADTQYQIDNMEAIAAHRDADGVTVLTLMSDNNYSKVQRTLLLQFAYRK